MKSTILALGLIAAVAMGKTKEEIDLEAAYASYCSRFDCQATSLEDYKAKLENFRQRNDLINSENMKADFEEMMHPGSQPARFNHNQFSDMSVSDMAWLHYLDDIDTTIDTDLGEHENVDEFIDDGGSKRRLSDDSRVPPASLDLREFVRHVDKSDQGRCGACWAIVANVALEGSIAMKHGEKLLISDQQIIDCDEKSRGCDGGWMVNAWDYQRKFGAVSGWDYAYTSRYTSFRRSECQIPEGAQYIKYSPQYTQLKDTSTEGLKRALLDGPVATVIGIDELFFSYASGIFPAIEADKSRLNHAVTIVGYTEDYWLLQNTFGSYWGEDGYVRVHIDSEFPLSWSVIPVHATSHV